LGGWARILAGCADWGYERDDEVSTEPDDASEDVLSRLTRLSSLGFLSSLGLFSSLGLLSSLGFLSSLGLLSFRRPLLLQ